MEAYSAGSDGRIPGFVSCLCLVSWLYALEQVYLTSLASISSSVDGIIIVPTSEGRCGDYMS